jgi:glyoxalase family protein
MTFFPYGQIARGRKGTNQLTYTAFLHSHGLPSASGWTGSRRSTSRSTSPRSGSTKPSCALRTTTGLGIELVANDEDKRPGWSNGIIDPALAIRGFHGVTLHETRGEPTLKLLTDLMEHRVVTETEGRYRLQAGDGGPGTYVDVIVTPGNLRGLQGAGTVHHVAFSTDSDETQLQMRERLDEAGLGVTPVADRNYFHSIYFREPGGVLFEVATNPPGFAIDEAPDSLGTKLMLPEWFEPRRATIEKGLEPIEVKTF